MSLQALKKVEEDSYDMSCFDEKDNELINEICKKHGEVDYEAVSMLRNKIRDVLSPVQEEENDSELS